MSGFVAVAALLALAAVAVVCLPLVLRRSAADGTGVAAAPVAAAVAGFVVIGGAAALYAAWGSSDWATTQAGTAATPADMISKLARRLEKEPNDVDGWLMLGRSYAAVEQYPLAARAYQRADRLENGRNVEALTGWAEALALGNDAELEGRAGRLFEKALEIDPKSPKALFFSAVAAQRRNELPLALQRFQALLAGGPPENVRPLIEQQIGALQAAISGVPQAAPAAMQPTGGPGGATPSGADGNAGGVVKVRVSLAPSVVARVPAGAPLFVFVRVPGQPGPPVAVKRLTAALPQVVELSSADSMMGGAGLAPGAKVEVTARIALGGQPTASAGDPFGQTGYDVGRDGEKDLVIDRLTP